MDLWQFLYKLSVPHISWACSHFLLLKCFRMLLVRFVHVVSNSLQGVTAQHLQPEGDIVDPAPWVDANEATEQRRVENRESFLVWVTVSWENLKRSDTNSKETSLLVRHHEKNVWVCESTWGNSLVTGLVTFKLKNKTTKNRCCAFLLTWTVWEVFSNTLLQKCPSWL